jgi:hypothetical protein
MPALWRRFTCAAIGGLLLSATAAGQKPPPAPEQKPPSAVAKPRSVQATTSQPQGHRIVVVEPIRVFDPFFDYPYPYTYAPEYMAENFGYVKIKTDHKDANVYVDGGFADPINKAKKFALRPGTHDIELRDSDGRLLFHERVAVLVGKTTELRVG